jgi:cytochrome c-type biogenesis protein CcmE
MATKAKHQRLGLAIIAVVAILGSALLAMSALQDKAAYFYAPSDLQKARIESGKAIRLGGMVAANSIQRAGDGTRVRFVVEDATHKVAVVFTGITPDLFKEKSGVIAEGSLDTKGNFTATNLLAKHDEKYMPPELAGAMHKTDKVTK